MSKKTITMEFENEAQAEEFAQWLCESGEPAFWDWCACGGEPGEADHRPAVAFDYWNMRTVDGVEVCGDFMADGVIRCTHFPLPYV